MSRLIAVLILFTASYAFADENLEQARKFIGKNQVKFNGNSSTITLHTAPNRVGGAKTLKACLTEDNDTISDKMTFTYTGVESRAVKKNPNLNRLWYKVPNNILRSECQGNVWIFGDDIKAARGNSVTKALGLTMKNPVGTYSCAPVTSENTVANTSRNLSAAISQASSPQINDTDVRRKGDVVEIKTAAPIQKDTELRSGQADSSGSEVRTSSSLQYNKQFAELLADTANRKAFPLGTKPSGWCSRGVNNAIQDTHRQLGETNNVCRKDAWHMGPCLKKKFNNIMADRNTFFSQFPSCKTAESTRSLGDWIKCLSSLPRGTVIQYKQGPVTRKGRYRPEWGHITVKTSQPGSYSEASDFKARYVDGGSSVPLRSYRTRLMTGGLDSGLYGIWLPR